MKQELIEKIKANPEKYAIENDGTVEQLNEVLWVVDPNNRRPAQGTLKYYFSNNFGRWDCQYSQPENRQIIKISEIFADAFEYGELIEVRDENNEKWQPAIHLHTMPQGSGCYRFIVAEEKWFDEYKSGEDYEWEGFKQARKIQKEEPKDIHNSIAPSAKLNPEHIKLAMQNRWCKVPKGMEQAVTDRMNELQLWNCVILSKGINLKNNIGLSDSDYGFVQDWDIISIDSHDLSEVPFSYFAALIGLEYKEPTIITYSIEPDGLKFGWKAESIPINEKTEAEINNFIERLKELKNDSTSRKA